MSCLPNSLLGKGLRASWECVAPFERFVEIGKADLFANPSFPMPMFAKNVTFAAADLAEIVRANAPARVRALGPVEGGS